MIQTLATATMKNLYIGVMSGTSVDAIDIVAVEIFDDSIFFYDAFSFTFETTLRKEILELSRNSLELSNSELKLIDKKLAHAYGKAINEFIHISKVNKNDIVAVGLHGQTIFHQPDAEHPFSLQIGDGQIVSDITKLTIIDDFRSADIKAGGQGAPLAPIFHSFLFGHKEEVRCVVNIGGIANISVFKGREVIEGYDIGPGNVLMDSWSMHNGIGQYDKDGNWAKSGKVSNELILTLMDQDEFRDKTPPKSTGTDYYNLDLIIRSIKKCGQDLRPEDVQRSLLEYTALMFAGIGEDNIAMPMEKRSRWVAISGGGSKNNFLVERIEDLIYILPGELQTTEAWGVESEWVEALGFAYLAFLRTNEISVDLSKVTGSKGRILLGNIHLPSQ